MLSYDDIRAAQTRIRGYAHRTPVLHSRQFDERAGCNVFFKAENFQRGGAFKFRGACNKIRAASESASVQCVVAYSSGNHAQAVALNAALLSIPSVIVMPADAPKSKIEATRAYGAEIVFYDRYTESRDEIAQRISRERNALLVPPYDDYLIMAGQGTAAAELLEEIPDLDYLLVPCSGGGLLAGSATAAKHLRSGIQVFGVEPEAGNDTYLSLQRGERVKIEVPRTIADGLQVSIPGQLTFPIVQSLVKDILLVSDNELVPAILFLLERMKVLVEPSGAAAAACLLRNMDLFRGSRTGVILSGGNMDLSLLREIIPLKNSDS